MIAEYPQFKPVKDAAGGEIRFRASYEDPREIQLIISKPDDPEVMAIHTFYDLAPAITEQIAETFHVIAQWQRQAEQAEKTAEGVKMHYHAVYTDAYGRYEEARGEKLDDLLAYIRLSEEMIAFVCKYGAGKYSFHLGYPNSLEVTECNVDCTSEPFRRTFENGFLETDCEAAQDVLLKIGDGTAKWFFGITPAVARQVAAAFSALAGWQSAKERAKEANKA